MSDRLIEFRTAEILKEKNFDVNTYSNCWVKTLDGDIIHNSERKNCVEHDRCEQYMMQPTQTFLRKWLVENHQIFIEIQLDQTTYPKYCIEISKFIGNPRDLSEREWRWEKVEIPMDKWGLYRTYEEALEEALIISLNNI